MRKIMNSPLMAWKMSGLFNTEIGLDDLLSPGVPNPLESSGSWLLEPDFSKFGSLLTCENEEITLTHVDKNNLCSGDLNASVHDVTSEGSLSDLIFDQPMPMLLMNELDFDLEVDPNDLIALPARAVVSPSNLSEAPTTNLFERLLLLNPSTVIASKTVNEELHVPEVSFGSSNIDIPEDHKDDSKGVSNGLYKELFLGNSLSDLSDLLPIGTNSPTVSLIPNDSKRTTRSCFPDHSYSLQPSDEITNGSNNTMFDSFNTSMDEFTKSLNLPSFGEKVINSDILFNKPVLGTLNLNAVNLTLIEELLAGGSQIMDSEVRSLVYNDTTGTKTLKSNEESDLSSSDLCNAMHDVHEHTILDEFMDECDDEMDETRKKYLERRRKNNIASRRSREIKKMKYSEMEKKAIALELENKKLKEKIAKMEMLSVHMKQALITRLKKV